MTQFRVMGATPTSFFTVAVMVPMLIWPGTGHSAPWDDLLKKTEESISESVDEVFAEDDSEPASDGNAKSKNSPPVQTSQPETSKESSDTGNQVPLSTEDAIKAGIRGNQEPSSPIPKSPSSQPATKDSGNVARPMNEAQRASQVQQMSGAAGRYAGYLDLCGRPGASEVRAEVNARAAGLSQQYRQKVPEIYQSQYDRAQLGGRQALSPEWCDKTIPKSKRNYEGWLNELDKAN